MDCESRAFGLGMFSGGILISIIMLVVLEVTGPHMSVKQYNCTESSVIENKPVCVKYERVLD